MFKKEYKNGEITVIWQPSLCIHSGVCFRSLPEVFKPRERPWIQMENAESDEIEATVRACPSGALSLKNDKPKSGPPTLDSAVSSHVLIMPNGPLRLKQSCRVTLQDGTTVDMPNGIAICRCGGSSKYPFCDGSHKTNGFKG